VKFFFTFLQNRELRKVFGTDRDEAAAD